jgi:flagellin-specific chaperone FliS
MTMVEPEVHPSVAPLRAASSAEQPMDSLLPDSAIPEHYDRLLNHLAQAERELDAVGSAGRSRHLEEASGIVFDLLYALNFRSGGELVPRLAALYGYIGNQLLNVGRTGDRSQLAHLRDMIATLKQSWYNGEGVA